MFRACLFVLLLAPSPAQAAPEACVVAHATAVEREEAGRHREARELFASCAKEACGAAIWQKCTEGLQSLSDLPTIIPSLTGEDGAPRTDVQVWMDRELLASSLDGSAITVEAGLHELSFTKDGEVLATRKIVIKEGDRDRAVTVAMKAPEVKPPEKPVEAPPPAPAPAPKKDEPPTTKPGRGAFPYLMAGLGVLGVGAGALLTYLGRKDTTACVPECTQANVSHIRTLYTAADVSFGVGAGFITIGVVSWILLTPKTAVNVSPTANGAIATFSGTF